MTLNVGTILGGRYEIQEKIGTGGMAVVYRGHDNKLERNVTIKVMKEEFTGDPNFKNRFNTEARSAARLSHPNIQSIYDVGEDNGIYYIVMEYIHGDSLKHVIQEKAPFDEITTLSITVQMAAALSHAHKKGVIHRDIKPQNILVSVDGTIKITDFGIARTADVSTATVTTNAVGSVYYFSPEQARGGYVDEKSDIYSLGITVFEMLTGHVPFDGNNSVAIALKHLNSELPDIRQFNPNVSDIIISIVKKATEKRKDDRYDSIDDMLSDLEKAITFAKDKKTTGGKLNPGTAAASVIAPKTAKAEDMSSADGSGATKIGLNSVSNADENKNDKIKVEIPGGKKADGSKPSAFEKYNKSMKISKDDDYENDNYEDDDYKDMKVVKRGRNKYDTVKKQDYMKNNKRKSNNYDNNNYEDDEDEFYRRKEKKTIIAAIVTALIIIGIISFFGAKLFTGGALFSGNSQVTVPNFTGMTIDDAKSKADKLGLKINDNDDEYSDYDEGTVLSQETDEGEKVAKGTEINVAVSKGKKTFSMPDVVNESKDDAINKITSLGGSKPEIQYDYSDTIDEGIVMEQNPAAQTELDSSERIILVVSKGQENSKIVVPEFVGKDISTVKSEIDDAGLSLGNISKKDSDAVKDKVISQSVASGTEVEKGTSVDFVISSGTQPEDNTQDNTNDNTDNNTNDNTENNNKDNTKNDNTKTDNDSNTQTTTSDNAEKSLAFTIEAPSSFDDKNSVSVKMLEIVNGNTVSVVYNQTKTSADFPFDVSIKGTGKVEMQLYIDNVYQWSKKVDFSEGN
ncbi:MAG: protein kinase [Clostridia bacterium]|jgi:serine/threonine-protein kinase|nr:protein kinase [Clostridia bacterium]MCI2013842.1 protein kinase [Clostridia bacterium]